MLASKDYPSPVPRCADPTNPTPLRSQWNANEIKRLELLLMFLRRLYACICNVQDTVFLVTMGYSSVYVEAQHTFGFEGRVIVTCVIICREAQCPGILMKRNSLLDIF